jgi:hypothetical protein
VEDSEAVEGAEEDFFLLSTCAGSGRACVAFSQHASARTLLLGWLCAVQLAGSSCSSASASGPQAASAACAAAQSFLACAESAGWDTCRPALEEQGYRVQLAAGEQPASSKQL